MADHAFLLKIKDLLLTDNDVDIEFNEETFVANDSLSIVEDVPETTGTIPEVVFSVVCPPETAQYRLFSSDPGPVQGLVRFVEYVPSEWESRWEFKGILSGGTMNNYLYSGRIEHIINFKLRTYKPLFWNHSTQKTRTITEADQIGDNGLEYVHAIEDLRSSIKWKGFNA